MSAADIPGGAQAVRPAPSSPPVKPPLSSPAAPGPSGAGTSAAPSNPPTQGELDPHAIARAVERCPSVASLSPGPDGDVATYLPNDRIVGIRLSPTLVEAHIVVRWSPSLLVAADEVRNAISPLAPGRAVDVGIDDVLLDETTAQGVAASSQQPVATTGGGGPAGSVGAPGVVAPGGVATGGSKGPG